MTSAEFAKTIRDLHPGAYDDMSDADLTTAVLNKYPQYVDMVPERMETTPEGHGAYPSDLYTTFAPNANLTMGAIQAPGAVKAGIGLAKGVASGLAAIPDAIEALPDTLAEGVQKLKGMLPNASLKTLGYGQGALNTEGGQALAGAAKDYAESAQPEIGDLVARAQGPVNPNAIVQRAAEDTMTEPIVPQAANTEIFNKPISQGMANSTQQMRDIANEQWKQVGGAIDNTLKGLEQTGTKYDPQPLIQKVESMYMRDAQGKLMTDGVQGETNQAISDALDSMKKFSNGDQIDWSDANRIKGLLQNSANYASRRFDEANESYKTVASLIKESIDDQAQKVLAANGSDISQFQTLRQAYQRLSSLRSALNPAVGKQMLQPSLGESIVSSAKKALPVVAGVDILRRMF